MIVVPSELFGLNISQCSGLTLIVALLTFMHVRGRFSTQASNASLSLGDSVTQELACPHLKGLAHLTCTPLDTLVICGGWDQTLSLVSCSVSSSRHPRPRTEG